MFPMPKRGIYYTYYHVYGNIGHILLHDYSKIKFVVYATSNNFGDNNFAINDVTFIITMRKYN
jgi:hypothetical protein